MTEENLKNKIEQLSESELKLLIIKANDFIKKDSMRSDSDKQKKIVAYLEVDNPLDMDSLKAYLKSSLPDYMIPSSFLEVEKIPLLPNGKIDKKELLKIKFNNPQDEASQIDIVKPTTEIEEILVKIWEDVLDITPISVKDNFFEIGGDSILSIQIISKARKSGISIAPNQLFEHQTISELAMFVSLKSETNADNETLVTGKVPLLPIQEWFFDTYKTAPEFWNQLFTIKDLPKTSNHNSIKELTKSIIETHDALRSRFYFDGKNWNASFLKPEEIDAFTLVDISSEAPSNYDSKIESTLKHIQENISLESGSLFKCLYFETGDVLNNSIILLAHHLIIDFVSWQIVLNNYTNAIYKSEFITCNSKTDSIKTWGNYLLDLSKSKIIVDELDYWKEQISTKNNFLQDLKSHLPILEKDISSISLEIDEETTNSLTDKANNAYNTKVDELILCALIETLGKWTNSNTISFAMERHGRETNTSDLDLSNTVGWFTAFFPKTFNFEPNSDIESKIMATKEQLRNTPNGGIGYGILRYLTPKLESAEYPEIIFNFLGKQNTGEYNIEFTSTNTRHPLSERYHFLEINTLIKNGGLSVDWSYGKTIFDSKTISSLIDNFNESLKGIVKHCLNIESIKYTPSDFPDVDLNQDDLDSLLDNIDF